MYQFLQNRTFAVVVLFKLKKNLVKNKELPLTFLTIVFWLALQLLRASLFVPSVSKLTDCSAGSNFKFFFGKNFLFLRCEFLVVSTCVRLLAQNTTFLKNSGHLRQKLLMTRCDIGGVTKHLSNWAVQLAARSNQSHSQQVDRLFCGEQF